MSARTVWAIVLAAVAAAVPLVAVIAGFWTTAYPPENTGEGVLLLVLTFIAELSLAPLAALVAVVLAVLARRDGASSRRGSTIAFAILALGAVLVIVQLLHLGGVLG